jgi:hypothetical protein
MSKFKRRFMMAGLVMMPAMCLMQVKGETISLRPVADTTIQEAFPGNNLGAGTTFTSGGRRKGGATRALLLFDIMGNLPPGAVVTSASLAVTVVGTPAGGASSTFDLDRVLSEWGEGDGSDRSGGAAADAGQASWDNRLGPGVSWAAAGGDYSGTASGTRAVTGNGVYTFTSTAGLISDVQGWLANPANNFGWMLVSESEGTPTSIRRFGSREDLSSGPVLTLQFNVPEPSSVVLLGVGLLVMGTVRRTRNR